MANMMQAMDNIWAKRIARNPNLAKSPMVGAMSNIMARRGVAPKTQAAMAAPGMKKGGSVKSSASKRADGIARQGKTKGKMV